jgi:predicted RND superfamily exporter protein
VKEYYTQLKEFHEQELGNAPDGLASGWFISVSFALFDLQNELLNGTYFCFVLSFLIALVVLLFTSCNIIISLFAIVNISFSIAVTIAVFVIMGWRLSIAESMIIITSVGLSVDFSCHYGVAYLKGVSSVKKSEADDEERRKKKGFVACYVHNNAERFLRVRELFRRVASAVFMAALTTFLAGLSMFPSALVTYHQFGQFLMLVMLSSYLYSTFFFVSLCALFGPTNKFGDINIIRDGFEKLHQLFRRLIKKKRAEKISKEPFNNGNSNNTELQQLHC